MHSSSDESFDVDNSCLNGIFTDGDIQPYRFEPICSDEVNIDMGHNESSKTSEDKERSLLDWCKCGMCKCDASIEENVCCKNPILLDADDFARKTCITMAETFQTVCLNKNILKTALLTWNNFYQDGKDLANDNLRFIAL